MNEQRLDYFLVIDEAHMLLQHIGLIEITKEFDKVALISATADDIKHFACFRDYIIVNPCIDKRYNRNIYVNKLIPDADEQRAEIVNLIDTKRMKYDKVLVKIEDKKQCKLLKEMLKYRYKVALYTGDNKEVKLNEDGLFDEDVDVIISTSSIQNGQSIKENILSVFVQTYIDTVSSVKQFLGRNQNRNSNVYVYVRYGKHLNKRKYSIPNNRYERYLNELRDRAWNCMSKTDWNVALYEFGRVRFGKSADDDDSQSEVLEENDEPVDDDESVDESIDDDDEPVNVPIVDDTVVDEPIVDEHVVDEPVNEPIVDIEFATKRVNGKRGRVYKLVKK